MQCENSDGKILSPGCGGEQVTDKLLVIIYSQSVFGQDNDSLALCPKCLKSISVSAQSHGYFVKVASNK